MIFFRIPELSEVLKIGNESTEESIFIYEDLLKTKPVLCLNVTDALLNGILPHSFQLGSSGQNYNQKLFGDLNMSGFDLTCDDVNGRRGIFTEVNSSSIDDIVTINNSGLGYDLKANYWKIVSSGQMIFTTLYPGYPGDLSSIKAQFIGYTETVEVMKRDASGTYGIKVVFPNEPTTRKGCGIYSEVGNDSYSDCYAFYGYRTDTLGANCYFAEGNPVINIIPKSDKTGIKFEAPWSGTRSYVGITGYSSLYCAPNPFIEFDAQYGSNNFINVKGGWYATDGIINFNLTPTRGPAVGSFQDNNYIKTVFQPIYGNNDQDYGGSVIHLRTISDFGVYTGCSSTFKLIDVELDSLTTTDPIVQIVHKGIGKIADFYCNNIDSTSDVLNLRHSGKGDLLGGNHTGTIGNLIDLAVNGTPIFTINRLGEMKIQVYKQNGEPTLSTDDFCAFWIDTDDSNKVYLLFKRGSADQVAVELS